MKFTYEEVAPYLEYHEIEKNKVYCEFRTPEGDVVTATAHLKMGNNLKNKVTQQVTKTFTRQAKRQASRLVRRALGGGILGRTGSTILRGTIGGNSEQITPKYTQEAIQQGIANAFKKVAKHFDVKPPRKSRTKRTKETRIAVKPREDSGRISKKDMRIYDKRVNQFQRSANNFDREILARMLVELAKADGRLSFEEEKFLEDILPEGLNGIAKYEVMDSISRIECQEVSTSVKEAIYLFAWIIALVDFELHENEKGILQEYAEMFSFSIHKVNSLIDEAKCFVLEEGINSYTDKTELFQLADKLELEHDKAERVLIQIKKRS